MSDLDYSLAGIWDGVVTQKIELSHGDKSVSISMRLAFQNLHLSQNDNDGTDEGHNGGAITGICHTCSGSAAIIESNGKTTYKSAPPMRSAEFKGVRAIEGVNLVALDIIPTSREYELIELLGQVSKDGNTFSGKADFRIKKEAILFFFATMMISTLNFKALAQLGKSLFHPDSIQITGGFEFKRQAHITSPAP